MKTSRLILICYCLAALVCASINAQSKRAGLVSAPAIYARIIQLEDERNLGGNELISLLKHREPAVRERAALAIGRIGDKRGTKALIAAIREDEDQWVRAMAAFALGEIEDAQATAALLDVVNSSNESAPVRAGAVEALGKIAGVQANAEKLGQATLDSVGQSLIKQLPAADTTLSADQKLLALLAITALMRLRNPSSVEPLAQQLKSKDAEIRAQAANALARIRQPIASAVPALIEALQDQETSAVAKLRAALDGNHTDANANARANAARALGVSKDTHAVEPLLKSLHDKSEHVQVNAVRALAAIGDRRAVEPLIELAKLSDPQAMLHRLRPPSFNLMLECVVALGTLKDERALPFLRELRRREGIGAHPELEIAIGRFGAAAYFSPSEDLLSHDANDPQSFANLAQGIGEAGSELGKELLLLLWMANYLESPAQPRILRSLARLKPVSLPFILREALRHEDVFVRATAASLIDEMIEDRNLNALVRALAQSKDDRANDAKLAILTAISKYKSPPAVEAIKTSLNDRDHLVRRHAVDLLKQMGAGDFSDRIGIVQTSRDKLFYQRVAARQNKKITATIHTAKGQIRIDLFPQDAPVTVDSFITLARKGYFNNLTFHRVVPNFVIQGGDPRGDGEGGPGYQIRCEINTRPYTRGAVGMALSGKDTGGSQFFITHSP
ncbi:MAG: HEAT repeat domain-containing protein, partial [Blastocatellia bacterium]